MRRTKKKLTKNKKKFFIIAACYVLTFILTAVITSSTLAWYNSSTWQSNILYMGGPVYIYFGDDNENKTSGTGQLVTVTPPGWPKLYPGMNINFEAKAVVEGKKFTRPLYNGETVEYYTTGAVLRARIMLDVYTPSGEQSTEESINLYNWIWPQLKREALADMRNEGFWIFDPLTEHPVEEDNYFYYVEKNQTKDTPGEYKLLQIGNVDYNVSVGFLNKCIIQMPPIELTNKYADYLIKFTIVFEAVQAFFPYEREEVGVAKYQGDTTNRSEYVTEHDVGLEKPLTVANSRKIFEESKFTYENYPQ